MYDQKIWKYQIFVFITFRITHLALANRFESKYRNCVLWDYQDNLWRKALPWVHRQSSELFWYCISWLTLILTKFPNTFYSNGTLSCAHIFAHFYNNLPKQNKIDIPYTLNNSYYLTAALSFSYPSQSVILPFPPICSILSFHPLFQSPVLHSLPHHLSITHS